MAPAIILADESTGDLDTRSSEEIMEILQRLSQQGGITILVVTHEREIAAHTQRIMRIRDGQIYQIETVAHPARAADVLRRLPAAAAAA